MKSDRARARHSDPETSHDAARRVDLPTRLEQVLAMLKAHPKGLTSYEAAELLQRPVVCVSPTFAVLAVRGLARDSGERRIGELGRARIVWMAV